MKDEGNIKCTEHEGWLGWLVLLCMFAQWEVNCMLCTSELGLGRCWRVPFWVYLAQLHLKDSLTFLVDLKFTLSFMNFPFKGPLLTGSQISCIYRHIMGYSEVGSHLVVKNKCYMWRLMLSLQDKNLRI